MTLPITVRSGSTPLSSCAPPCETRKPVMTSSKTSSGAVLRRQLAQQLEEAGGGRDEAHVGRVGLAQDRGEVVRGDAARTASGSFHGTTTVAAVAASGTPGEAGMPCVARPEPASASSPSTWPW